MHRLIMGNPKGKCIDHKNRLVNDNRRLNLRETTNSLNQANRVKAKGKSSIYKGVTRRSPTSFEVSIRKDDKYTYLGRFTDEIAAASCYNYHAKKLFGEFARVNDIEFLSKEQWESKKSEQDKFSKYKGVHWKKTTKVWRVRFHHNSKEMNFGYYTSEDAAANVYNYHAQRLKGDKAVLNDVPYMSLEECQKHTKRKVHTSKYIGVKLTSHKKWASQIYFNGKTHNLGSFENEEEAAKAYNQAIIENNLDRPLNKIIEENDKMTQLIKLEQPNCRPCSMVSEFLVNNGVTYTTYDVTEKPEKAAEYGVMSVPVTILLDDNGKELQRSIGCNYGELEEMISKL